MAVAKSSEWDMNFGDEQMYVYLMQYAADKKEEIEEGGVKER